jgi:ABC-type transport system substrate-binding protein
LAYPVGGIPSPTALRQWGIKDYSLHAAGTGPFKVESFGPESLVLVRNDDYWGKKPKLSKVTFLFVTEPASRSAALEAGDVQIAEALPFVDLERFQTSKNFQVDLVYSRLVYIVLNNAKYSKEIRQALNYAIDKESIIRSLFKGQVEIAKTVIPPKIFGAIEFDPYPYNVTKAKELLAKAGYATGFKAKMIFVPGRYVFDKEVLEAIQSQLKAVNIEIEITPVEVGEFDKYRKAPVDSFPDMYLQGWGTSTGDIDYFVSSWYLDQPPTSYCPYYKNPTVENLLRMAKYETDIKKQLDLYRAAQTILWDDAPFIFLYTQPTITVWSKNLKGVEVMASEIIDFRKAYLE